MAQRPQGVEQDLERGTAGFFRAHSFMVLVCYEARRWWCGAPLLFVLG